MGNGVLVPSGSSGCCPCPEVSGCDCANACTLQCRSRSGAATLCGWPAFIGDLGKRYKSRGINGDLVHCSYEEPDCPTTECAEGHPHNYQASGSSVETGPAGFQLLYSWTVIFAAVGRSGSDYVYQLLSASVTREGQISPEIPGTLIALTDERVSWGNTPVGGTATVAPCGHGGSFTILLSAIDPREVGGNRVSITASARLLQAPPEDAPNVIVDHYDATCDYDAATCIATPTDNSEKFSAISSCMPHSANSQGPIDGCAFDGLGLALTAVGETETTRTWQAPGECEPFEDGSRRYTGEVEETLADEDTVEDAIDRETPSDWADADSCLDASAFATDAATTGEFSYREAQVRVLVPDGAQTEGLPAYTVAGVNLAADELLFYEPFVPATSPPRGSEVVLNSTSELPSPLVVGATYYLGPTGTLHATFADAMAGTSGTNPIAFSGGSGVHSTAENGVVLNAGAVQFYEPFVPSAPTAGAPIVLGGTPPSPLESNHVYYVGSTGRVYATEAAALSGDGHIELTSGGSTTAQSRAVREYQVKIKYWERPLGVGGPFLYLGRQDTLSVTTDLDPETEEWTDWIDVPLEHGQEIRAGQCLIEEVSS